MLGLEHAVQRLPIMHTLRECLGTSSQPPAKSILHKHAHRASVVGMHAHMGAAPIPAAQCMTPDTALGGTLQVHLSGQRCGARMRARMSVVLVLS